MRCGRCGGLIVTGGEGRCTLCSYAAMLPTALEASHLPPDFRYRWGAMLEVLLRAIAHWRQYGEIPEGSDLKDFWEDEPEA